MLLGDDRITLAIKGAVVAAVGSNSKNELDTTIFNVGNKNCGETAGTTCTGTVSGQANVCKVETVNSSTLALSVDAWPFNKPTQLLRIPQPLPSV